VVIDTGRFLGNAPGWARLSDARTGAELLPRTRLQPDVVHRFRLADAGATSLVRLDIYPDGGISRLQLLGEVAPEERERVSERWLELIGSAAAATVDRGDFFD
jgi:allantoicase